MANLSIETHDGMYHISSQAFCLKFPQTEKNTRVLCLLLRTFHDPDTGKHLFTHEQIAKAFGYKTRQNIQNFEQEFRQCGEDILAYLQRKCKVDASVVEALAEVPVKIRLMVVAFTLYYWNVPLSRIAVWMGVSPATVLNWTTGLAVALSPMVAHWIVMKTKAISLAVDEKWLKIDKAWHYWFVGIDEATGLPVGMSLLSTRTTWACAWFLLSLRRLGLRPRAIITDGLEGSLSSIRRVFPTTTHVLCMFHHQQGVTRWLRLHAIELPKQVVVALKRAMKRVVQTRDPRTVRRRLARLATTDGAQACGLDAWISQTEQTLDRLEPAVRGNAFPRTTNSLERFFRAFQRFYKTRGGFHSVMSAQRQLMLFVVGYVFTVSPDTGTAPIEQILPQAKQMPFYHMLNVPFRHGLFHICQSKSEPPEHMATQQASLAADGGCSLCKFPEPRMLRVLIIQENETSGSSSALLSEVVAYGQKEELVDNK